MLQGSQLKANRDYRACEFPFKRDYGMAPRRVPSSAGLPDKWSEEMDRFICFSDAVGDTPTRMVILSLKKRFPELNQFALSEIAIERRIYCLDRMENNYFKKGAYIAVQRLESAGITLPSPDFGPEEGVDGLRDSENMSPVESTMFEAPPITQAGAIRMVSNANAESGSLSSARYANERYINKDMTDSGRIKDPFIVTQSRTPSEIPPATPKKSANSTSTIRMPSYENVTTRSLASMAKLSSSNLRPGNDNSSRAKDLAPAASFHRLRISEDDSSSYVSKSKPSMESYVPRRDVSTSSNDANTFSYGSPRTPVGRVRPTPLNLRTGSGRRANDENTPLNSAATGDDGKSTLSSSRYV
ncbi:MAG: hypothetical protein Q9209_004252 [Squamulea sp. 1 TL-2023]